VFGFECLVFGKQGLPLGSQRRFRHGVESTPNARPYVPNCSPGLATLHTRAQCSHRK
jgi:hypothetical protein